MLPLISSVDFQIYDQGTDMLSPRFRAGEPIRINKRNRVWICKLLKYCGDLVNG